MIGTVELTFTKGSGTFYCANCSTIRPYKHQIKRQFLTIYFIPLIPLQMTGEFVRCGTCQKTFDRSATTRTEAAVVEAEREQAMEIIRRVMVVIVAADNEVSDDELDQVQRFARQIDTSEVTPQQILHEAARIRQSDMDVLAYIRFVARPLKMPYKEVLVIQAFLAATAGGCLSDARQTLLAQLPDAIGISESRFRELIVQASEQ